MSQRDLIVWPQQAVDDHEWVGPQVKFGFTGFDAHMFFRPVTRWALYEARHECLKGE